MTAARSDAVSGRGRPHALQAGGSVAK